MARDLVRITAMQDERSRDCPSFATLFTNAKGVTQAGIGTAKWRSLRTLLSNGGLMCS
jgi:hypothetical protein